MYLILFLSFYMLLNVCLIKYFSNENWSNTYSGWPGPLEDGSGRYYIPELSNNPKYNAPCRYKKNPLSGSPYYTMRELP